MATCAVIPCYNVGALCRAVIEETKQYVDEVIVVDDGSTDETAAVVRDTGVHLIGHPENRGKGAALLSAFRAIADDARFEHVDVVITLDGDGQHRPIEIFRLREFFRGERKSVVIGSRNVLRSDIKFRRRFGNWLSTYFVSIACRQAIPDTQSGFRMFARDALAEVLPFLRGGRYETETEFLIVASRLGYQIVSAPISTIYSPEAEAVSQFAPLRDTVRVSRVLLYYLLVKPYRKWHTSQV